MIRLSVLALVFGFASLVASNDGEAAVNCRGSIFDMPRKQADACMKRRDVVIKRAEQVCNERLRGKPSDVISRCIAAEITRGGF